MTESVRSHLRRVSTATGDVKIQTRGIRQLNHSELSDFAIIVLILQSSENHYRYRCAISQWFLEGETYRGFI